MRTPGVLRAVLCLCICLCVCACGPGQVFPTTAVNRVDAAARRELADGAVAGVSIAVAVDDKVVFERGWGLAALEPRTLAGPRTRYRIQSVTKLFTAVAVLRLVEERRLALTDAVTRWFPELPGGVTIAHLLTHTSGLPDFWKLESYKRALPPRPADVVPLVAAAPVDFAPGARFDYANSNFLVLGLIVEQVTGRALGEVLRDVVFAPAEMTDSGFDCETVATRGYMVRDKVLGPARAFIVPPGDGSASVCASAPDVARFAQALMAGRLLRPDTVAMMLTPQKLADGTQIPFGLGADLEPFDGRPAFGHLGGGAGFDARLTHLRDEGITIVVLSNTASDTGNHLRYYAARAARGLPNPGGTAQPLPISRARFVGDWQFDDFVLHVFEKEGAVWARINAPAGERLVYLGEGVFGGTEEPEMRLRFSGDELVMDYYGTVLRARRQP